MFAKTIIDSDAFLELPPPAQLLYFHLGMRADDDGFVNKPKSILRLTGCSAEDLELLVKKEYLIRFDSGVVVIRHWKVHNTIKNDRYRKTNQLEELAMLRQDETKAYRRLDPTRIQSGSILDPQDRLGKDSLGKDSSDQNRILDTAWMPLPEEGFRPPSVTEVMIYCKMRKNNVDPERFVDYYAKRGWRGISDWREVVQSWEQM